MRSHRNAAEALAVGVLTFAIAACGSAAPASQPTVSAAATAVSGAATAVQPTISAAGTAVSAAATAAQPTISAAGTAVSGAATAAGTSVAGAATAAAGASTPAASTGGPTSASPLKITLAPQNNSGISGTATLTDLGGGKTRVDVTLSDTSGNRPAHIHEGTCANLNPAPKYPLTNVINGTSTTEISVSLSDLLHGPYALNVHKSGQEASVYVACGDIK